MLRVPRSVADGDIGAFFHQLIFREEEQQILSEGILCYKVKKKKKKVRSVRLGRNTETSPLLSHSQQTPLAVSTSWSTKESKHL